MERIEVNVKTGRRLVIAQKAYMNEGGDVIILDASDPAPEGFKEYVPEESDG